MKKLLVTIFCIAFLLGLGTGCGKTSVSGDGSKDRTDITVISRESGSGTRGAFTELFGLTEKDANGQKIDKTIDTADISNSTGVVLSNVSSDKNAIGYISIGSLNDSVKTLNIDGVEATAANVKSGAYKIARPFNIAVKGVLSAAAQDFVDFILSAQGQTIVEQQAYIPLNGVSAYRGTKPEGKIVIAGSSSVAPLMEKLKEAYLKINDTAVIEIQQSDSSSGMKSTMEGICDIGMASRDLKESELSGGLKSIVIATDGIAVIVNPKNTLDGLSKEQVRAIYAGELTKWSEVV